MIKKHIPNTITCLNLFSGAAAIYLAFKGETQAAFLAILLAAVFDFLDGLAAVAGADVGLTFVPHLTPLIRGIHATLYARLTKDCDLQALF
ncbi:MAG TPA: CDP-alcohol phosphatidyltransferase family protein, partial [Paludibacter sp.]|nr:CDP-alcohol phosphatidyltransferase family protein [Paludibacter sp.]